jgi:hypothetical protein
MAVQADVQITEIMYDVSGTDTGREWIEVTNIGDTTIDISGYRLFENNVNHALTNAGGTGVLQPGGSAIVADDATKFKIDWPSYAGSLFDSSFSLSNTGEPLVIKDDSLNVLDSATYDSGMGATGDGNSLQRKGSSFVAGTPTPGAYSAGGSGGGTTGDATEATTTPPQTQTQTQSTAGNPLPEITVRIQASDLTMVGGGSFFSAKATGTQGMSLQARIMWNFGDGTTAEGSRVFHAYRYPGKYAVTATASYLYSAALTRTTIEALAAAVSLVAESDGSLTIVNESSQDLDIGLWSLAQRGQSFVIPEDTVVLAGEGVRFAQAVTRIAGDTGAELRYPNGATAASAAAGRTSALRGERVPASALRAPTPAAAPAPLVEVEEPVTIDVGAPAEPAEDPYDIEASQLQSAAAGSGIEVSWLYGSLLALAGVIAAGIMAVRYAQNAGEATSPAEDEFEIEA